MNKKLIAHYIRKILLRSGFYIIAFGILIVSSPSFSADFFSENADIDLKIGQMIMVGFRGLSADELSPVVRDIKERNIGGVILFDYDVPLRSPVRNIKSPGQLRSLIKTLQRVSTVPLFVAIDQEGGKVNRLKEEFGFPRSVSEQYLGKANDIGITEKHAEITAQTLAGLGINVNFAPVVDLNINPYNPVIGKLERSFSADPAIVTQHSLACIKMLHRHGILSTIKHFPGHGSSRADSHKGFVDVTESWSPDELKPFRSIIESGMCDMVMTAHIFNGKLDPEWPATLSNRIIEGILRDDLQYDGVVLSDDMQMDAVRGHYSLEEGIERAILAGCDILVFGNNSVFEEDIAARAIEIIKKLMREGVISRERIDESYRRIRKLKKRFNKSPA